MHATRPTLGTCTPEVISCVCVCVCVCVCTCIKLAGLPVIFRSKISSTFQVLLALSVKNYEWRRLCTVKCLSWCLHSLYTFIIPTAGKSYIQTETVIGNSISQKVCLSVTIIDNFTPSEGRDLTFTIMVEAFHPYVVTQTRSTFSIRENGEFNLHK